MRDWVEQAKRYLRAGQVAPALRLAERNADDKRPVALLCRVECLQHSSRPALALVEEAWRGVDASADPKLAVNIGLRALLEDLDEGEELRWLERLHLVAESADDDSLRGDVLAARATTLRQAGALDRAESMAREAVRLQLQAGNEIQRGLAFQHLGRILYFRGRWAEASTALESARRWYDAAGHELGVATMWHVEASVLLSSGNARRALELAEQAVASCERIGLHGIIPNLTLIQANAHRVLGDHARALATCDLLVERFGDVDSDMAWLARGTKAAVLARIGRIDEAEAEVVALVEALRPRGEHLLADLLSAPLLVVAATRRDVDLFEETMTVLGRARATYGEVEDDVVELALLAGATWNARGATRDELDCAIRAFAVAWEASHRMPLPAVAKVAARGLREVRRLGADLPLGDWLLGPRLGAGAMGEVWAARSPSTGQQAAVKLLAGAAGPRAASLVQAEIRTVAALDHPNIVGLLDQGLVPGSLAEATDGRVAADTPYLVMELVHGATLQPLCGRMAWSDMRDTLLGLLDALAHAHARGLVHLDVKPDNVLIDLQGHVRLTDFGVARALLDGVPDAWAGTPAYMAPEQFERSWTEFGPWTDLYALGCLGWALATGSPVFGITSVREAAAAHRNEDPPVLSPTVPVPQDFEGWLRVLLAKRPSARFQRASEAALALQAVGGRMVPARPGSPPPMPSPTLVASTLRGTLDDGVTDDTAVLPRMGPLTTLVLPDGAVTPEVALRRGVSRRAGHAAIPQEWGEPERAPGTPSLALLAWRRRRLVGRDRECALLWSALRQTAVEGVGRTLILRAAPGLGRSALLAWLLARSHEIGGAMVLRTLPTDADPLGEMVRRALRIEGDDGRRALVSRLEELGLGRPRAVEIAADLARDALPARRREAVATLLARWSAQRPVVVALDDVHRDPEALALAGAVHGRGGAVLVVASVARAAGLLPVAAHDLEPLGVDDVARLLRGLLPLQDGVIAELSEATHGNPHLAELAVQLLIDRDALVQHVDRMVLRRGFMVDPPRSVDAAWQERIAGLVQRFGAEAAGALREAAVLGTAFDRRAWSSPDGLEARCLDTGLLVRRRERLGFAHDSARHAAASASTRVRR